MALDDASQRYLASQTRGRLATVGPDGAPQNKPVGFVYNAELGTIDIAGFDMESSAKYRNVGVNPNVAFVIDDAVSEGAAGTRFVEIRGQAERVSVEPPATTGVSPQIIRIHPRRVISWNVDPDRPGPQTRDVAGDPGEPEPIRPSFGTGDGAARERTRWWPTWSRSCRQAGTYTVPTSPTGTSLMTSRGQRGWCHPAGPRAAPHHLCPPETAGEGRRLSCYEIVQVLAPAPDVAVAQVRRVALDLRRPPARTSL
jgi:pyridoxamine 5'-phosphate oxidase family protein